MAPKQTSDSRSEVVHVRLTPEARARLQAMAREDGANESELLRRLIADEYRRRHPGARPKPPPLPR